MYIFLITDKIFQLDFKKLHISLNVTCRYTNSEHQTTLGPINVCGINTTQEVDMRESSSVTILSPIKPTYNTCQPDGLINSYYN